MATSLTPKQTEALLKHVENPPPNPLAEAAIERGRPLAEEYLATGKAYFGSVPMFIIRPKKQRGSAKRKIRTLLCRLQYTDNEIKNYRNTRRREVSRLGTRYEKELYRLWDLEDLQRQLIEDNWLFEFLSQDRCDSPGDIVRLREIVRNLGEDEDPVSSIKESTDDLKKIGRE